MDKINDYIQTLYGNNGIITKNDYEKNNDYRFYCPTIDTSIAAFLSVFIKALRPKKILELGTSIGYSTTVMASAVKSFSSKITTIEFDKHVAKAALDNFKKYDVDNIIELITGDAVEILPTLGTTYDLIFLDLYNQIYPDVLDSCITLLNSGGVMLADDTLFPVVKNNGAFHKSNQQVHLFNERIASSSLVDSYLLPLDDGITIIVKK